MHESCFCVSAAVSHQSKITVQFTDCMLWIIDKLSNLCQLCCWKTAAHPLLSIICARVRLEGPKRSYKITHVAHLCSICSYLPYLPACAAPEVPQHVRRPLSIRSCLLFLPRIIGWCLGSGLLSENVSSPCWFVLDTRRADVSKSDSGS